MNNLTDQELSAIIEKGNMARRILARRMNARLDARSAELDIEIKNRQDAIELVKIHRVAQHPVVQKYVDQVLARMEKQLSEYSHEQDMLRWQRVPEELYGQPQACA
jgi:hypothetical protein